jgi:hypothetical protein
MTPRKPVILMLNRAAAAAAFASILVITTSATSLPKGAQTPEKTVTPVAKTALESLLPVPAGWTKGPVRSNTVSLSDTCAYSFADAAYSNGEMRVRVTVADTGFDADSLIVLVPMIASLPDDYNGQIPPATTVQRLLFQASPAASRWDAEKNEGEFEVLVGKRFVAKAEGTHLDKLATLRGVVEQIDVKKLAALK